MQDFLTALNWFALGAIAGYLWHPIWEISKKIFTEASKARQDWKQ
jgi:hypothetical protein